MQDMQKPIECFAHGSEAGFGEISMNAPFNHLNHRGWEITADYSCPSVAHTFTATGPDFDCDMVDGQFVVTGGCVHAATYEELIAEIDGYIEENAA